MVRGGFFIRIIKYCNALARVTGKTVNYDDFLSRKRVLVRPTGLAEIPSLNRYLKGFQRAIVAWALRQGNAACFAATGLGKTLMQLEWARVVSEHEDGPVLILTPLAVAEQTVQEAEKFDIPGVRYAASAKEVTSPIVVTNYERFSKFNIDSFAGIVLDESSIIKNQDGATRELLTRDCADVPWKLCASATPAPNDYIELGSHAEFLDVMTYKEMLATFFIKDDTARMEGEPVFRLKRHATKPFWEWLASWAVMIRGPEDLGFDGTEYQLPPLVYHRTVVESAAEALPGTFFAPAARTLRDRIRARRSTLDARVEAVLKIVATAPEEPWLLWCNLNDEANELEKRLSGASQVAGSYDLETKVGRLLGFKSGRPRILISKPSLSGHGLNWQHCAKVIFVGLTDSFESTYQAIRRVWRFGQVRQVDCYFVHADIEGEVVNNLKRKERDFDNMLNEMSIHMVDKMRENVRGAAIKTDTYDPQVEMELPDWLST